MIRVLTEHKNTDDYNIICDHCLQAWRSRGERVHAENLSYADYDVIDAIEDKCAENNIDSMSEDELEMIDVDSAYDYYKCDFCDDYVPVAEMNVIL